MNKPEYDFVGFSARLGLLANPVRMHVLHLMRKGEYSVGELAKQVGVSQSALSQHLSKLKLSGLVNLRTEAQWHYYSLGSGCDHDCIERLLQLVSKINYEVRADTILEGL